MTLIRIGIWTIIMVVLRWVAFDSALGQGTDEMGDKPFDLTHQVQSKPPRVMRFPCKLVINCDQGLSTPSLRIISDPHEWYQMDYDVAMVSDSQVRVSIRVLNFGMRPHRTRPSITLGNKATFRVTVGNNFSSDTAEFLVRMADSLEVTTVRGAQFVQLQELRHLPPGTLLVQIMTQQSTDIDSLLGELAHIGKQVNLKSGYYRYVPFEIGPARVSHRAINRTPLGYLIALNQVDTAAVETRRILETARKRFSIQAF